MITKNRALRRQLRIRGELAKNQGIPRLTVFRSHNHIYAQIIDDRHGITLVAASSATLKSEKLTKIEVAAAVGENIGKLAKAKKIDRIRFDRGPYRYHGRVKQLAESARASGLKF
ncbi:MAG: 50S ribosomal protein L18 [Candidatus Shapirobacteria bacterium]|jgi:large subunit ribosomal protein L18